MLLPERKLSLKDISAEIQRRYREDPLEHVYKVYPRQLEAHQSRKPVLLVVGGNRSGKTWFAVAEALLYALGRATYAGVPSPPVTVWYVMPSLPMFRRTVLPVLRKLVPENEVIPVRGDVISKRDNIVSFKNGSSIHFLSADMRQRRLQGASIDLAIMDETPDEEVFKELQARVLDRHGRVLMVFAPIDVQSDWVRDNVYLPWTLNERSDIDVVLMPVADRDGNPLVPHFTREDIEQMERQWPDPQDRAARIYGEFITRAGIVFKSFNVDTHVIRPFPIPKSYARWLVIDPEYHRFAALFFAADEHGNYIVTDEYFSQDDSLARRAERLAVIVGERDRPLAAYVDSANPQDTHELNWHFQRIGAPISAAPLPMKKQVDKFILRVHALLEPDDRRVYPKIMGYEDTFGAPRLFFFDTLASTWKLDERSMQTSRLMWELARYSWGKDGRPDKESADGADAVDCLTYGCSIIQAGVRLSEQDDWRKKLTPSDAAIWDAIHRQDRVRGIMEREWRR